MTAFLDAGSPARTSAGPAGPGFAGLGVSAPVIDALAGRGITEPFAIQTLVLGDALAGRDVLASSRTGSGKTLAYALPTVERVRPDQRTPAALVLVPTRELAGQVATEFRAIATARRLRVAAAYGGVPLARQAARARRAHILIATPGRLLDLVRRGMLTLDEVRSSVLDEADRMLDMGFLPDVTAILELLAADRQTMLFSATLDAEVARLAARFTREPVRHEIREQRPVVSAATHRFVPVDPQDKHDTLVRELAGERELTLVFVRTRADADRLARQLRAEGFGAQALHGGMPQSARERTLGRFAAGRADVLVATDVAARGLHLDRITHVVNFDPPSDAEAYVHRVGRTARAGRGGTGLTLVTPAQRTQVGRLARRLKLFAEFTAAGLGETSWQTRPASGGRPRRGSGSGRPGRRSRRRRA